LAQVVNLTAKTVGTPFECPDGIVQISPDGSTFVAIENFIINDDNTGYKGYSVYKKSKGEKIFSTSGFNNNHIGYGSVTYSPDSHTIAIADSTDSLKIYSLPDGELIRKIKLEWPAPTTLNFTPDGKNLVYGSYSGSVAALDFAEGKTLWRYNDIKDETIIRVVISPKGKYVTAIGKDNTLAEWEPDWNASPVISVDETPAPVNTVKITPHPVPGISRLEFTSALLGSGKVEIFTQSGERVATVAFEKPARTCETEIDMSGMPAGVYVYRITVSGREISTGAISKY
jgi:WD40 repeat protein